MLWLNQLVTLFRGPWQVVGSTLIPGALLGGLVALPWIDRAPHRITHRRIRRLIVVGLALAIGVLSLMGYLEHHVGRLVD